MTDTFDEASNIEDLERTLLIQAVRNRKEMPFTGRCLYCNAEIDKGRYCDASCRDDHELEQRVRR